jgi:hypothetical protein
VEAGAAVAPAGVVPPAISTPANTPQRQRLDIERANGRERRFALHLLAFFGPGIGVAALLLPASAVRHFCWSGVCLFASTPSSSPALSRLKISARSRDAWASEFANHLHELASTKEGGGAPKGAYPTSHAVLSDVAIRDTSAARATDDPLTRIIRFGRARLPALHRGFRRRANAFDSIKAALHAMKYEGITLAFGSRLSQAPGSPVIMPAGTMP